MLSNLAAKLGFSSSSSSSSTPKSSFTVKSVNKSVGEAPVQVTYTHNDVAIPDDFLTTPPSAPITSTPIDWKSSPLPEYDGCVALVLENVLSHDECKQLLSLAEASVPRQDCASAWRPALVSLGPGWEAAAPGYRESDRIIWDQQTLVDRLWERCAQADGLRESLAEVQPHHKVRGGKWLFRRCNERMRFLKYSPGQYFKPHCDGPYWYEDGSREFQTFYTIHLYLNDSVSHDPQSDLEGGATAFLNRKLDKKLDVNPKAGSVLIFQHRGLLHEGSKVIKGTKYTMRTDILYEWVLDEELEKESVEKSDA